MKSLTITFPAPRTVELREEAVGDPGPGQVLLRTSVSLISTGTEGMCYRGDFDPDSFWGVQYPHTPGYSNVGQVIKVGRDVERYQEGDRIFNVSSHRQYAIVDVDHPKIARLPESTPDEDAAWSWLAVVTQTGVRRSEQAMGETAAVIGLGPLGQFTVQYLRLIGLREVMAIDPIQHRLDLALAHGATSSYCGSAADAVGFVEELTDDQRADVVYDVTGNDQVFSMAQRLAKSLGTVALIGDAPHPSRQRLTHDVIRRQLRIVGTQNDLLPSQHAGWCAAEQIPLYYLYLQRGQMRVCDLVSHRFSPEEAREAYTMLEENRGETMGVVFCWRSQE
ncbi:MAG: zinc-binding dehydrogenase [Candidatus Latescibacteria bacterium]|jgi:2-desacetyl-2-hydroxyethyl bacteriochlorophyllide A dehydrogenase|nr:zinc-binding dehydrogenase [Candidatus Latescibacterota bacterium]